MTIAVGLAAGMSLAAALATWRLAPLHPIQLWTIPWALATSLYALHLLPYRPLGVGSAALIAGATLGFSAGALAAAPLAARLPGTADVGARNQRDVAIAALLLLGLSAVALLAFLTQVANRFGVRAALVSSYLVRRAIGLGELSVTIKYVYVVLGAAIVCALAAECGAGGRRATWLAGASLAALSTYFSTGRSTIVVAVLMAAIACAVGGSRTEWLTRRAMLKGLAAVSVLAFASFTIGGSLVGKTFENSEVSTIDSPFTRHHALSSLALPYLYGTAPIAAFDQLVAARPEWGRADGCATLTLACQIGSHAGLDLKPEAVVRAFTKTPLAWNTYTALDAPLIDGGPVSVIIVFLLTGAACGALWEIARRGFIIGRIGYGVAGTAVVLSVVQYNFLASHFLAAAALAALAVVGARSLRRVRAGSAQDQVRS